MFNHQFNHMGIMGCDWLLNELDAEHAVIGYPKGGGRTKICPIVSNQLCDLKTF